MGTSAAAPIIDALETLKARLATVSPAVSEPANRALYHCERLSMALASSHAEGVRFAAFTINHTVTTNEQAFGPEVGTAAAALRSALDAAGYHIHFNF